MEFTKLSAPSLKELFVRQLETMILSGRLPVGEQLPPERELAQSMQVSRAVVNAGIAELAGKGFLIIKPRVGNFVADYRRNGTIETLVSIMKYNGGILRDAEIRSILELRIALDTLAVELCIPRITEKDIAVLKECVVQLKNASSPEEASELAFRFQHELAFISGNTFLPLIFSSFKVLITPLWERFCRLYGPDALYNNTDVLCGYIEQRDAQKAVEWMNATVNDAISGKTQIYF